MKKSLKLGVLILLLSGCMVKPPGTGTELGSSVSTDQINAALIQAQTGVAEEQAYHVGDYGSIQIIDNVVQSTYVVETHELQVTGADPKYIYYTEHVVESGHTTNYAMTRSPKLAQNIQTLKKQFSVKSLVAWVKSNIRSLFPIFPEKNISRVGVSIAKAFDKIEVNTTSAEASATINEIRANPVQILLSGILNARISNKVALAAASPTPTPSASPSPSPSPSPSATASPAPTSTSKYYGLSVTQNKYTTANCSQIPNCTVNATKIQFVEVRTFASGNSAQLNWTYEISKDVPGLFMILDECYSTVITQNDNQYPLTECAHVGTFKFGSTSINASNANPATN